MSKVVVIGSYVQDLSFKTQSFPVAGETRIGTFTAGPGGKGFNQAVACHRQGVSTCFIGAVGEDGFAHQVRGFIEKEKLKAELEVFDRAATGAASIVVNEEGENLIVVALGANDELSPAHIESRESAISEATVILVQLESSLAATRRALELAKKHGATTILNPAPINPGFTLDLLPLTDILVPNETEFSFALSHLFKKNVEKDFWLKGDESLHELCRIFKTPTVVLTLGANGCFVSHSGTAEAFYRVPAIDVSPLDTTGAGDAFNGGLAAGITLHPGDFKRAVEFANAVAGISTTRQGTAPAMPFISEVRKLAA